MSERDVLGRLDQLERELADLRREVAKLRTDATQATVAPPSSATPAAAAVPAPTPGAAPRHATQPEPQAPLPRAWHLLERGNGRLALTYAFEALRVAQSTGDLAALDELASFAASASGVTSGAEQERARQLSLRVELSRKRGTAPTRPPEPEASRPASVTRPVEHVTPARPPVATPVDARSTAIERGVAWARAELTGPRAFAITGGIVTLLGVVFFFVLAANRGWVGPTARVTLGGLASALAIAAGVLLHWRYGRVNAALGAAGAGIAGAYATLAAATILYGYLPPAGALVAAAAIAAVGSTLAVAWSSQILAGLALVGAAVAPAAVALDDGIDWPGTAFTVIVLVAAIAVAAPRRWLWLDAVVAGTVVAQVAWLAVAAPADDVGAVSVTAVASTLLVAAAICRQAYALPALDGAAASFALASGGVALLGPIMVLADDREAGLVLLGLALVDVVAAVVVRSRWRDLAWTIGAVSLLLGGVAAAFIVSGRSLTIVWAIEAAALAFLAWRLSTPRFAAAALAYLGAGSINAIAFEIGPEWSDGTFDVPGPAAAGLFVLSASTLAVGLLLPAERDDTPSGGIAAGLEPIWDALVRGRTELRAALAIGSATIAAAATAAVVSGTWLTIVWAALAVTLAVIARAMRERRIQPFALGYLLLSALHAVTTEVPVETLTLARGEDALAPVPSLAALAAAAVSLALAAHFEHRGIRRLGPVTGVELAVRALERHVDGIRETLALVGAVTAVWAAALVAVDVSYGWGQVAATTLWVMLGVIAVARGAHHRNSPLQIAGGAVLALALLKSAGFDWEELDETAAVSSLLTVSAGLLVAGFAARWLNAAEPAPIEVASIASGATAAVAAIVGLERLIGIDERAFGVSILTVTICVALAGLPPYRGWRSGRAETWLRRTANGYWLIGIGTLLLAESVVVLGDDAATIAAWSVTAAILALAWNPLSEDRSWLVATALTAMCAVGALGLVTTPDRLVDASVSPASGLWSLALVIVGAWVVAATTPPLALRWRTWALGCAAALTLYGASLAVLELAIRVSDASITTDFQRGHTALSAIWGAGALALYVVGLARDRGDLRVVGLALFGLALAKLFLYDLSTLSSITRALSFLALGAILLAAGFFAERLVGPAGDRKGAGT